MYTLYNVLTVTGRMLGWTWICSIFTPQYVQIWGFFCIRVFKDTQNKTPSVPQSHMHWGKKRAYSPNRHHHLDRKKRNELQRRI